MADALEKSPLSASSDLGAPPEMSVLEAIYGLRATRIFEDRPVPKAIVERVLEAATMACSSGNTQPWEFVVVTDPEIRAKIQAEMKLAFEVIDGERAQTKAQLTDAAGRSVTGRAAVENLHKVPVIVVDCWNPERGIRMKGEYAENPDGSLRETREIPGGRGVSLFQASQNMMLAARAYGLASLFTTFFFLRREQIREILGLPPQIFMECAIFLGYGEEKLGAPRRLPVAKVSHSNRWGRPFAG
jgi:nitroreductase